MFAFKKWFKKCLKVDGATSREGGVNFYVEEEQERD